MSQYRLTLILTLLLPVTLAAVTPAALALDGISAEAGAGKDTTIYKLALQNDWDADYAFLRENHLRTYWEVDVAEIEGRKSQDIEGRTQKLNDFGFTPVLRWQEDNSQGVFAEIGIGAHYFTQTYNNDGRVFGSDFQFGDHVGLGYRFRNHVEVTLKFQHYSDADIKQPNPGLNVGVIKVACSF
jgi:lipid A 3-O-deacylase